MNNFTFRKAFSLMEVLITITIIAIMATVILANLTPSEVWQFTSDTKEEVHIDELQNALIKYATRYNDYPATITSTVTPICAHGYTDPSCIDLSGELASSTDRRKRYIAEIPEVNDAVAPLSGFYVALNSQGVPVVTAVPPDATAPTVLTQSPVITDKATSINPTLTLTFNEAVQKGTGNIIIKRSLDNVTLATIDVNSAQVTTSGTPVVTIIPTTALSLTGDVYVQIDATAIKDMNNNAFAGYSGVNDWKFAVLGSAGLFVNSSFTGGVSTDSFGSLPTSWNDYSSSYTPPYDSRSRLVTTNNLNLIAATGTSGALYHGLRQNNRISIVNCHTVTARYRILSNVGVTNQIRFYDGAWTNSTNLDGRALNTWFTETYDLDVSSNTNPVFSLYLTNASASASVEFDYVSLTTKACGGGGK